MKTIEKLQIILEKLYENKHIVSISKTNDTAISLDILSRDTKLLEIIKELEILLNISTSEFNQLVEIIIDNGYAERISIEVINGKFLPCIKILPKGKIFYESGGYVSDAVSKSIDKGTVWIAILAVPTAIYYLIEILKFVFKYL